MSTIYVRDKDKNLVAIPMFAGSNGNCDLTGVVKSVNGNIPDENGNVEIAISDSGGANKFVVRVTYTSLNGNTVYTTDKTSQEIYRAWERNEVISCEYGDPLDAPFILQPMIIYSTSALFCGCLSDNLIAVTINNSEVTAMYTKVVTAEDAANILADYAKAADIPTDAYINGLIDRKLEDVTGSGGALYVAAETTDGKHFTLDMSHNEIIEAVGVQQKAAYITYQQNSEWFVFPFIGGGEGGLIFGQVQQVDDKLVFLKINVVGHDATVEYVPLSNSDSGTNVDVTIDGETLVIEPGDNNGSNSGGNVDYVGVEPAEDDMPKVFITGVKPTTKDDVLAEMEYVSKTDNFHAYLEIKCQGTSSMSWPKKNFTIKMFADEAREMKLKKSFKDWNHESNKFVLKANYIDHAHARNIVSARLWGEVVASRQDYSALPEELRNSPNNGAVDGFPIKIYYNGTYEGVYTWNIGKDDWMWGMDEDNPNHVLLCAEGNTDGVFGETTSNFRALWNGVDGGKPGWSVEVGTNSTALKNSLNNLIQFVMDNDGDAFRNGIGNYLDIQSAIDYYIFQYEICGLDGLAHNMLLATYDGVLWRCGAYDMDSTFGLWWNGRSFVSAQYACPEDYQERYSLLWERIESNFLPELKARQAELRKTVLSYSNMVTHFERFMDIIGLDLYAEDLTIYTGIPSGSTNNIKQIRNYIRDRQTYVDAEFSAMSAPVHCTGISLNKSTISFSAEGTQTLTATVTPDGCTDAVMWESDNTSIATVNGGVVTANANGNATITARCGNYSASCSVSVSGIAEPVACTGITLDKTELTFDGKGTQTITATVTPADTTDTVVWSVNPSGIVSVSDGVVTAVGDGSCVITATCGEKSAICTVSVSGVTNVLLYNLPNETELDGTNAIDTGVKLFENDIDYTIAFDVTPGTQIATGLLYVFSCAVESSPYPGITFRAATNRSQYELAAGSDHSGFASIPANTTERFKGVLMHKAGGGVTMIIKTGSGDSYSVSTNTACYSGLSETMMIGCGYDKSGNYWRHWVGTVHAFKIYDGVVTIGEMGKILGANLLADAEWSDSASYKFDSAGNVVSGGTNYVMTNTAEVVGGKNRVVCNIANGSYKYLGFAEYDENMTFIKLNGGANTTSPYATVTQGNTKYVRVSMYPNNVSTNNSPATQIAMF